MGSPPGEAGRNRGETQHPVVLTQGFWMAELECTQSQWRAVMGTSVADLAKLDQGSGKPSNEGDEHPIFYVTPQEAMEFCERASRHLARYNLALTLPTEAQWEYACRAGTATAFNCGVMLDPSAAVFGNRDPHGTRSVGSKKPNAWSLYDMHGNVSEWCAAGYGLDLPASLQINPQGPGSMGGTIVHPMRGGTWYTAAENCRSADRNGHQQSHRSQFVGFRFMLARAATTLPASVQLAAFPIGPYEGALMEVEIQAGTKMRFRWCPPTGSQGFVMGQPADPKDKDDKGSQRTVVLTKGFWMAETECSQAQWQNIMGTDLKQHAAKLQTLNAGAATTLDMKGIGGDFPMYYVSHEDALAFCSKASMALSRRHLKMRLPTEAEWEYACRAGTLGKFAFGDDISRFYACYDEKSGPQRIGLGAANPWMLRDMHGNLWEWCIDGFNPKDDGSKLVGKKFTDPVAPSSAMRVMRGGGWDHSKEFARSDNCGGSTSTNYSNHTGFRTVLVP